MQRPRNYVLVKITEDGKKEPLNEEEFEKFKIENPEIYKYLTDPEERKKLTEDINPALLISEGWEKSAKKLMSFLWKVKEAEIFHRPVDPVALDIPDYFHVIEKPMDFSTIKKKLNSSLYTNFKEFDDDINLTFNNCYKYNGTESSYAIATKVVKQEYDKLIEQLGMKKFL